MKTGEITIVVVFWKKQPVNANMRKISRQGKFSEHKASKINKYIAYILQCPIQTTPHLNKWYVFNMGQEIHKVLLSFSSLIIILRSTFHTTIHFYFHLVLADVQMNSSM